MRLTRIPSAFLYERKFKNSCKIANIEIATEIALDEMSNYDLRTGVKERVYLNAVIIFRGELRDLKKRKVAEVSPEHEKKLLMITRAKKTKVPKIKTEST